jgi:site-specific recombinase XerD
MTTLDLIEGADDVFRRMGLDAGSNHQRLLNEFRQYLLTERGLAERTIEHYTEAAQAFLVSRAAEDARVVRQWSAADVLTFVQRRSVNHPPVHMRQLCTGLRAFLRYLCFRGRTESDLSKCVPRIAHWRLATLPKSLSTGQVDRMLLACRRDTAGGRRDYVVLLLLSRLGLRAQEIRRLTLDDIHWQRGELTVRGKCRGPEPMPLPQDVGEALAAYLTHGRPASSCRSVFLRLTPPHAPHGNGSALGSIVRRAMRRAAVDAPSKGTHIFLHTLATEMLRGGASLREIGHLLRHRDEDTTRLYAKVDLVRLRTLALAWPGGVL